MNMITLNNGVEMPALGLGVFQTPPRGDPRRAPQAPAWAPVSTISAARCSKIP
jgi:diketogulonate reductase-like aldo/keto reductase